MSAGNLVCCDAVSVVVVVCAVLAASLAGAPPGVPATLPLGSALSGAAKTSAKGGDAAALKAFAETARAAFLEGDFKGAVAAADALKVAFEQGAAWRADDVGWAAFADSRLTRALALRRLGKEQEADDELRALAVIRPTLTPDKSFVPPKVVARFDELREGLLNGPTEPLTVVIKGTGTLTLDGRVVPRGVLDVLPGPHWLGVDGKGRRVDVVGPMDVTLDGATDSGKGENPVRSIDDPVVTPPAGTDEDGPPWVVIGVVTGVVVVAAVVTGVVLVIANPPAKNPGGTTLNVDASKLDPKTD